MSTSATRHAFATFARRHIDPRSVLLGSTNWLALRFLVRDQERAIGALAFSSVLAGIAEGGILACIAQVAAALLANPNHIHVVVGPLAFEVTVAALLSAAAVLAFARVVLQGLVSYLQAKIAAKVQTQLRNRLFVAFSETSWPVQSSDSEGHLQEMLTSQVVQAVFGTVQTASMVSALFTFIALICSAMLLNAVAAAVVVAIAFVISTVLRPLSALGQRRAKDLSQAQMGYAHRLGETIRLAEENHVFGAWTAQRSRIEEQVAAVQDFFYRTQFVGRLVPNLYQGLIYLAVVGGLGLLYATNAGPVASLGAVVLLLVRAASYGQQLQGSYQVVRQALPFVHRLQAATDVYAANRAPRPLVHLPRVDSVSFSQVSFSYKVGQPVLSDIAFEISRPQAVGIIGPSAAGKSTLVQLLLQLRCPDQGTYTINDLSAASYSREDWHRQVAYVPQEPRLLHASVAENIRYFRTIDDATVERAAKLARIHEDITQWSSGYETVVGPRADSVSGGQQQRICLARALASNPSLLILDEPTSALDPQSEALIHSSLEELARDLLVVIVTHRPSALAVCDQVLVVVDGRVDGFGTQSVLKDNNGYFQSMVNPGTDTRGHARQRRLQPSGL